LVRIFRWCPASSEFLIYPVFFHSNAICQHYIASLIKGKKPNLVPKSKGIGKIEQTSKDRDKKTTQKPKTYTKDDYHRPIKTRVRSGVPAE
jgi:hypothetical protein